MMSGSAAKRGTVYSNSDSYAVMLMAEIDPLSVVVGGFGNESWNVLQELDDGLRGDQSHIGGGRAKSLK